MNHAGPRAVRYCRTCLTPNTRPRVVFDDCGSCNACRNAVEKGIIDWDSRKKEFLELLDRYRRKDGTWDCLVPWSGGKDSSAIAYKLKFEFGMNPLLVTFSPMIPNSLGRNNREKFISLGFDQILLNPNQKIMRRLARRFFIERGNPKIIWEAGKEATPVMEAVNHRIPLVFYAEHGESEYGGKVLSESSKKKKDFAEVIEHLVGDDARNWTDDVISPRDLNPYVYPSSASIKEVGVAAYYFSYFFRWSMFENYQFIREKMEFETAEGGRTSGTCTNFDSLDDRMDDVFYYLQFIKFGFGRTIRDASRLIQNGHMTREEGLELARKYDHEFPERYLEDVLLYLGMTREEFMTIVDKHRNREIWECDGDNWRLKFPLI